MVRQRMLSKAGCVACCLALGAGCVPQLGQNKPREPSKAVPGAFRAQGGAGSEAGASSSQKTWYEFFPDPSLRALIKTALSGNQELSIRLQELVIAKSESMARSGEYLPKVDARAGAGLDRVGKYTSQGRSDEAHNVAANLQNYQFGFAASWEVDIWKKLRNGAKAANYRYLATIEGRKFLMTQLVAEIASTYYELLSLDSQLEVLSRNIQIQQSALEIVRFEKQAARTTQLAVQRFEAEVLKNQSRQFRLEQARIEAENRVNFLLGRYPQPVPRDVQRFKGPLPQVVKAGIPSRLLEDRPDIRQAELELEASKLDVKAAKAAFYPSLTIDAGVGYQAFNVKHLIATPESLVFGIAGGLTAPLLNRRAIKAQYQSANARQIQAVLNYERTLLAAFTEVVNQLAMIDNLQKGYELQAKQVDTLTQSIEVSNVLFQSARADYMEVLLTRRDALDAEMELIETRERQLRAMVSVYQALGGGTK